MMTIPIIHTREMIRDVVLESHDKHRNDLIAKYQARPGFDRQSLSLHGKLLVPKEIVPQVLKMSHSHYGRNREIGQVKNCDLR